MIQVIAHYELAEPGDAAQVRELLAEARHASLEEPGCRSYDVFVDVDAPHRFTLVEVYDDAGAVTAHRESPHFDEVVAGRIWPLLAARDVHLVSPVHVRRSA